MLKFLVSLVALTAGLPALAEPKVVTDIPPVHSLVSAVMAGIGEPRLLLRSGTSPHELALRPSDAAALQEADAVFWIGPELSPMLEKAIATLPGDALGVALLDLPETARLAPRDTAELAGHDHAHHEDDHADPHAWLDPENGLSWLGVIAETLVAVDPENAALYRANAEETAGQLRAAAEQTQTTLNAANPSFALAHDELQYFSDAFGISPVTALSDSAFQAPGPRRMAAVLELLEREKPACILAGPETAPATLAQLAEAADARILTLDIMTAGQVPGPGLYPGLFPALAETLAACQP